MRSADQHRLWAVVPIKTLDQAKSRLSRVLKPGERYALALGLLRQTLSILRRSEGPCGILVVSADPVVRHEANAQGVDFLMEPDTGGLNEALTTAAAEVIGRGGTSMLVIPGDLPLLTAAGVDALVRTAAISSSSIEQRVAIAPDRRGAGTNALLLRPPGLVPFCFGPDSFQRHLAAAQALGVTPVVFRSPAFALDLDLPSDLASVLDSLSVASPEWFLEQVSH